MKQRRHGSLLAISAVLVFIVTYMLILPAVTMTEKEIVCGKEEHVHVDSCYQTVVNKQMQCTYGDFDGIVVHHHDENCYSASGELVCTLAEIDEYGNIITPAISAEDELPLEGTQGALVEDGLTLNDSIPVEDGLTVEASLYADEPGTLLMDAADGLSLEEGLSLDEVQLELADEEPGEEGVLLEAEPSIAAPLEAHTHSDACYDAMGALICGKQAVVYHQHDSSCFLETEERVLSCGMEYHIHSPECYADRDTTLLQGIGQIITGEDAEGTNIVIATDGTVGSGDDVIVSEDPLLTDVVVTNEGQNPEDVVVDEVILSEEEPSNSKIVFLVEPEILNPADAVVVDEPIVEELLVETPDEVLALNDETSVQNELGITEEEIALTDEEASDSTELALTDVAVADAGELVGEENLEEIILTEENTDGVSEELALAETDEEIKIASEEDDVSVVEELLVEESPIALEEEGEDAVAVVALADDEESLSLEDDVQVEEILLTEGDDTVKVEEDADDTEEIVLVEEGDEKLEQDVAAGEGEDVIQILDEEALVAVDEIELETETEDTVVVEDEESEVDVVVLEEDSEPVEEGEPSKSEDEKEQAQKQEDVEEEILLVEEPIEVLTEDALEAATLEEAQLEELTVIEELVEIETSENADAVEPALLEEDGEVEENLDVIGVEEEEDAVLLVEESSEMTTETFEAATESFEIATEDVVLLEEGEVMSEDSYEALVEVAVEEETSDAFLAEDLPLTSEEAVELETGVMVEEEVTAAEEDVILEEIIVATEEALEVETENILEVVSEESIETTTEEAVVVQAEVADPTVLKQLTYDGPDYHVIVSYYVGIPDGAELAVRELFGEEYDIYLAAAIDTLGTDAIPTARFFDITIMKDGKEIEPTAAISVEIEYDHNIEETLDGEVQVNVLHFSSKEPKNPQVLSTGGGGKTSVLNPTDAVTVEEENSTDSDVLTDLVEENLEEDVDLVLGGQTDDNQTVDGGLPVEEEIEIEIATE